MSGTPSKNDIRTWSSGADSAVPDLAWDIYVARNGELWLHDRSTAVFTLLEKRFDTYDQKLRYRAWTETSLPPDGIRLLVGVIANEALAGLEPVESE
jgi:hypothetical protein